MDLSHPESRIEKYLAKLLKLNSDPYPYGVNSRVEAYLRYMIENGVPGGKTGYYYNEEFYKDPEFTEKIEPIENGFYISTDTNAIYYWNGEQYVPLSGGSGGGTAEDITYNENEIYSDETVGKGIQSKEKKFYREEPEIPQDGDLWLDKDDLGVPSLKSYNSTTGRWEYVNADIKPYLSLKRRSRYLYDVSFISEPVDNGLDTFLTALCSSYVKDGKLYRNLDWRYDHTATFHVQLPDMEGLSFINGLTDDSLDDTLISQLPYHMVDGVNENGIMVSTHVLYNDWNFEGTGSIPLTKLPYLALKNVKSMATIETDLADILDNIVLPSSMQTSEYLIQVLVTDGTTSYILTPDTENNGVYVAVDISSNPKLTNFKWVSDETVVRTDLQTRPTGVERWNMMPCSLEDLRFTKSYESPIWLSEFIGENGTTKDSTDADLTEIYNLAHSEYLVRIRDGTLWQTMHSVVYSSNEMEHLWIQENWEKDYISSGSSSTSAADVSYDQTEEYPDNSVGFIIKKISDVIPLEAASNNKLADKEWTENLINEAIGNAIEEEY